MLTMPSLLTSCQICDFVTPIEGKKDSWVNVGSSSWGVKGSLEVSETAVELIVEALTTA